MRTYSFLLFLLVSALDSSAQLLPVTHKQLLTPVYFLDSVNVREEVITRTDSSRISSIAVYKGLQARRLVGEEKAADGVVFVETREFARRRFERLFSLLSRQYRKTLEKCSEQRDSIVYVLNGKVLNGNYETDLASLTREVIESVTVLKPSKALKKYALPAPAPAVEIVSGIPVKEL